MCMGARIQALRKAAGLTQAELAERMKVSFQTISGWERGEYLPETNRLKDLAEALGVRASALVDAAPQTPPWELRDRLFSEERMHTYVRATAAARGFSQTAAALEFARKAHEGQFRKGADRVPYINHPLTMACHALAMGLGDGVAAAALLHDVCEDCGVPPQNLPVEPEIQRAVALLSFEQGPGEGRAEAKARYFAAIGEDPVAAIVKAIDRCNNVSTMASGFSREKMAEYIVETESYVLPLLERIKGCWPEYSSAAFLLKYQLRSLLETQKRMF